MKSKRGAVEIQFNWIFALIAGALIIALLAGIIIKQKNISESSVDVSVLNQLDAILSDLESTPNIFNKIRLPETKIEFGCNNYFVGKSSKQINAMSVFAFSILNENVIAMTYEWNMPYKVANFVYLTNPDARYIFVGNSPLKDNLANIISQHKNTENAGKNIAVNLDVYDSINKVVNKNDDLVRIIFFDSIDNEIFGLPSAFKNMKKGSVTALRINGNENYGQLEFYENDKGSFDKTGASYYLGEATLLGAIFTDKFEVYNCAMKNAVNKWKIIIEIYNKKIDFLHGSAQKNGPESCNFYGEDNKLDPSVSNLASTSDPNLKLIMEKIKSLEKRNKEAMLSSCPLIY
ncbi:hypothetical protein HYX01_03575 [Candidatus Woesearchaeota archaeon]|nr:hypothetical protein [Candidatus Woesearchaeota archaeon]